VTARTTPPNLEIAVRSNADLGEGPVWDDAEACLYWVDILRGERHVLGKGGHRSESFGAPLSAVVPTTTPGWQLIVRRDGVYAANGRQESELARIRLPEPNMRFNDAKCDPAGRLWAGTMSAAGNPSASLYCIDKDLRVTELLTGLTISNGLGWSPDATRMYHVDTPTGRIDAYEFHLESGVLGTRRMLAEISPEAGLPDGLCVDSEGFVWVALWGGGAVHRYGPEGGLDAVFRVPTRCPTSCAFGG